MIGVFDSGYGGLTVWRKLVEAFPQHDISYLADTARAPYGSRTPEEIYHFTQEAVELLFERGCQLVILACNTASAIALRQLQQEWLPQRYPERRVLGVLVPLIEEVVGQPFAPETPRTDADPRCIGLLATEGTVRSGAFEREIAKRDPSVCFVSQACPRLAGVIEDGADPAHLSEVVTEYVRQLKHRAPQKLRAVLLGCTHYPLAEELIQAELGEETELFCQPSIVTWSLRQYLGRHGELSIGKSARRVFLTTGDPELVSKRASGFIGQHLVFQRV